MLNDIISVVLQVLIFSLIPFVVYWVRYKKRKGFFDYIGLKKSNARANRISFLAMLLLAAPILLLALFNAEFMTILTDPSSVTGKFRAMGFSWSAMLLVILMAVFKTALAEEILFRGFLAKRLIAWQGFQTGNIIQAVLFGLIHLLIFLTISNNILFLTLIFLIPTIGAYVKAYINEKLADGSIIPSWIIHAGGNVLAYSLIGFVF